jgi:hypothetical protein
LLNAVEAFHLRFWTIPITVQDALYHSLVRFVSTSPVKDLDILGRNFHTTIEYYAFLQAARSLQNLVIMSMMTEDLELIEASSIPPIAERTYLRKFKISTGRQTGFDKLLKGLLRPQSSLSFDRLQEFDYLKWVPDPPSQSTALDVIKASRKYLKRLVLCAPLSGKPVLCIISSFGIEYHVVPIYNLLRTESVLESLEIRLYKRADYEVTGPTRETLCWLVTFLEASDIPSLAIITLDGRPTSGTIDASAIDWNPLDVALEKTSVRMLLLNLRNNGLETEIKNLLPRARARGLFRTSKQTFSL